MYLIRDNNLILWGDPGSNRVLARIADKLPIRWTSAGIMVGKETFPAATHALIAIYPNPLNPSRYVVLNSGPTQREFDYLNNARQVPKLPDYAVVDLTTPPGPALAGPHRPGRVLWRAMAVAGDSRKVAMSPAGSADVSSARYPKPEAPTFCRRLSDYPTPEEFS